MKKGATKEKLIMGMPMYGRSYTLSSATESGLYAPTSGKGPSGEISKEAGFFAYYEICHRIKYEGWQVVDRTSVLQKSSQKQKSYEIHGPYAFKNKEWVSYDDQASIRRKVSFI